MKSRVPIVDFSSINLDVPETELTNENLTKIGKQIVDAFTDIGFVYLKNHGVSQQVNEALASSEEFFSLSLETKIKYARGAENYGYVQIGKELLGPQKYQEIKECFNVSTLDDPFPVETPRFNKSCVQIFELSSDLAKRILKAITYGLELNDKESFMNAHSGLTSSKSVSTFRFLHYPAIPAENDSIEENAVRCGEHSDYGTITLLFQDGVGGLEVLSREGEYVKAPPIADTVLINVGDLLQRWTADLFVASKHRVPMPPREERLISRRSIAFFVHPYEDTVVECLDGSGKYEPITAMQHVTSRFDDTYT